MEQRAKNITVTMKMMMTRKEVDESYDKEAEGSDTDIKDDEVNPWDKLRDVINDLSSTWTEQVEENLLQGLPKHDAQIQASTCLLFDYRKRLRHLYLQYLRWQHALKTDPVRKKVMKTLSLYKRG